MKIILFTLFIFFALASARPDFVDTDGNKIKNGGSYYILPALWGKGGGLSIASTSNELSCPLSVVQTPSELFNGLPIRISSPHKTDELETNYILEFTVDEPPSCAETPAKLTVVSGDVTQTVKLAGHGNTVSGWFKVQALNGAWMKKGAWIYKIEFCPTVGDTCADIGISHDDDGNRVLAITHNETPFMIVFAKAE
ncbi:hypothetical protein K1719_024169 [Acacia pycnantha]|nr:hypothetical protein K1719_024169 [Acacia pycnantha]